MSKGLFERMFEFALASGTAAIRLLPPELAHAVGMRLVATPVLWDWTSDWVRLHAKLDLSCDVPGLGVLEHPIGLAAGFDKDCDCPAGFRKLGFSFVEIGTVTPRPQPGNPSPRLFRMRDAHALINRMGFNGVGMAKVSARLRAIGWNHDVAPLGVNIGKNKLTKEEDAIGDYLALVAEFAPHSRYLVVNISSPNTPGLRGFANEHFVRDLFSQLSPEQRCKTWVKLDPDLPREAFQRVVAALVDCRAAGVVLTNTHRVERPYAGGQSGHPLLVASTARLEWAWEVHRGMLPMIGVGGIFSGADVFQKLIRGASAVQIYSALVYGGPLTVKRILSELEWEMELAGFRSVRECVGSFYAGRC